MHRKRRRAGSVRKTLALLTGGLLAATSLALTPTASTAAEHPEPAAGAPAAAEDFQQVTHAKGEPQTGEPKSLAVLPHPSDQHQSLINNNEPT
ncbi:hypothetical protein, partial [Streptomyces sp. NPDC054888]